MNYNYSYELTGAALAGLVIVYLVAFIIGYVWLGLALGRVFGKLGQPSWKAWVPVLNAITLWQLGGFTSVGLLVLAVFVSPVGLVFSIISIHRINERFGKGVGFTVLGILLPLIWMSILGFGKDQPIGGASYAGVPAAPAPTASIPAPAWAAQPVEPPSPSLSPSPSFSPPPAPPAPPATTATFTPPPAPPAPPTPVVEEPARPSAPAQPAGDPWAPPISNVPGLAPAAPVVPPTPVTPPAATPSGLISPPPLVEPGTPIEPIAAPVTPAPVVAPVATPAPAASAPVDEAEEEGDGDFDATVIVRKRGSSWSITPESGAAITLTKDVVILGRNPSATTQSSGAQLVALDDPSKTVSKSHARLSREGDVWTIVDLKSTNGVYLLDASGEETELEAGVATPLTEGFKLGDLVLHISKGK